MHDITLELAKLQQLTGADFIRQLKLIVAFREFKSIEDGIFSALGEDDEDYQSLMNAARKAVFHGYNVYILPNPGSIRTADFIFERKGVYKMYDLKTVVGKSSIGNRLTDSIGQTNRVLLNVSIDYNPIALARSVRTYFERNPHAIEVLIYKGRKSISVIREDIESPYFFKFFVAKYIK